MQSEVAQGTVGDKKVLLLKPVTYMNSSGEAVRLCVSYFKVQLTQMMVVCDDIAIPFGSLRMKTCGSSGGHNGLKSIESHLGTQAYARLRVGIGDRQHGDLADYVLAPFLEEEKQKLPNLVEHAAEALECWLHKGIVQAMQFANVSQEGKKPDKNLGE
jgi:peptidyl-tRNA hydrolase, PTH1 family